MVQLLSTTLHLQQRFSSLFISNKVFHNSSSPTKLFITLHLQQSLSSLFKWFDKNRPKALTGKSRDKFEEADIDGITFLDHAGDKKYFHEECKLPIGTSERLARLAMEIVGGRPPVKRVSYYLSCHAHHVDSKLTTSQETDSRPKMWR